MDKLKPTMIILDINKPGGQVYDISNSFNARVGDNKVPLVVKFIERGIIERMKQEQLTPFMTGYVGQPDEKGKVTAETGTAVAFHGSSDNIIGTGLVKMNLPGAMFPQEGRFYGFFGLENDKGKRVTTNTVCFQVENDDPDMYFDALPFRTELQKLLDEAIAKSKTTFGDINTSWETLKESILTMLQQGNLNLDTYLKQLALAEQQLKDYEKLIDDGKVFTQNDLNDLLAPFNDILDALNNYRGLNHPWLKGISADVLMALSNYASTVSDDENVVRILNLQDIHVTKSKKVAPDYVTGGNAVMKQLYSLDAIQDKVDMVVVNGDNVDGSESRKLNVHRNQQVVNTIHGVMQDKPVLFTMGNHDDGSVWKDGAEVITLKELTDIYDYQFYNAGEIRPDNSASYAYYDFPNQKVRAISLSGFENPEVYNEDGTIKYKRGVASVFTAKQLNWLVQALKISSDWSVIIFNHSPYEGFYNNAPYNYITNLNHNVLKDILKAFVNGTKVTSVGANTDFPANITADFSEQGKGTLITNVFGHEHRDAEKVVIDGIPAIERTCDIALTPDRKVGTSSEYAFDIIEINILKRTIKFNRFGAGESVSWSY